MLWNGCEVVVRLGGGGVAPETAPHSVSPLQSPPSRVVRLIEFLPIVGLSVVVGSAGETAIGGGWVTVFPLSIGLVVFPLVIGLLVFCASAMGAVRPRTLRPITAMRFTVMSDLPVVASTPMKY
jgi:hypothetical protein